MKLLFAFILLGFTLLVSKADEPRVAFLGDSITYGGRWTTSVESALRSTRTIANAEIFNDGIYMPSPWGKRRH